MPLMGKLLLNLSLCGFHPAQNMDENSGFLFFKWLNIIRTKISKTGSFRTKVELLFNSAWNTNTSFEVCCTVTKV